jgi:hypothetical protein
MLIFSVIVTIASCTVFSFAYIYFLGLRIIRTRFVEKQSELFMGLIVCSGILAATVSLEAVLLISVAREVAGQLFYVASSLGILVLAFATAGVIGYSTAIKAALLKRAIAVWGLIIGNLLLLIINILCFTKTLPSVL